MKFKMPNRHFLSKIQPGKKNSLVRSFFRQFLILLLCFSILFFLMFEYLVSSIRKRIFTNTQELIMVTEEQTQDSLNRDVYQLLETATTDSSFARLGVSKEESDQYFYISKVSNVLKSFCTAVSTVEGYFVCYPDQDIFVSSIKEAHRADYAANDQMIRKCFMEGFPDGTSPGELPGKLWFFMRSEQNEESFLIRVIKSGPMYLGTWITESRLKDFSVPAMDNIYVAFTDYDGNVITSSRTEGEHFPSSESAESPRIIRTEGIGKELLVSRKLNFCKYYLNVLLPYSFVTKNLSGSVLFFILAIAWLTGLTFFTIQLLKKVLSLPVSSLEPVMEEIQKGKYDVQLVSPSNYSEIEEITAAFNRMIAEIRDLKNDVYEEQLMHREFELKYLKNQVAPHFLINCLNSVFVSSQDTANRETTETIIRTLSEHLRYTLSNDNTVSLRTELYYLINYCKLTQCRFPETLRYEIDADEKSKEAQVFPLILLTLTENSIKTGLIMGEPFRILVKCNTYEAPDGLRVRLLHTDSGSGVSEEKLELFNHIIAHPEVTDKGTGIGLYNTAMRLRMLMGNDSRMIFRNAPGMGLQIEMDFLFQEASDAASEREVRNESAGGR